MVRVAPGAQWQASVAAQVSWKGGKNLNSAVFKCIQAHCTFFFWLRTVHSVAVNYMIWSIFFHVHSSLRRWPRWKGGRVLSESSSGQMRSAPDFLLLHFFCDAAEPSGAWAQHLPQLGRRHLRRTSHCAETWRPPPFFFFGGVVYRQKTGGGRVVRLRALGPVNTTFLNVDPVWNRTWACYKACCGVDGRTLPVPVVSEV